MDILLCALFAKIMGKNAQGMCVHHTLCGLLPDLMRAMIHVDSSAYRYFFLRASESRVWSHSLS